MGDTNYFSGTVKILENPIQKLIKKKTLVTTVRVEISQIRQTKLASVVFWGNLGNKIMNSYKRNDYLLIEGYTSIKKTNLKLTKIIITSLKAYPLLLNSCLPSKKKVN